MSKIINNLQEFLDWRGCGDEPYRWARAFYKYTDCGPWTVFLMTDQHAVTVEHAPVVAKIVNKEGQAVLTNTGDLPESFVSFLGFTADGLSKTEREWDTYLGLIDDYLKNETKMDKCKWPFEIQYRGRHMLYIQLRARSEHHPATHREIYYEDIGREKDDGSVITVVPELCVGIKFGSIVEGSDAYSGPFEHMFPFDGAAFDRDIDYMEKETSFYWKRDNATWYKVVTDDDEWVVANVWGDIEWEGEPPQAIKDAAEAAIKGDWQTDPDIPGCVKQTIPEMPSIWCTPKESDKDWKSLQLGDTGAEIYTFTDDGEF